MKVAQTSVGSKEQRAYLGNNVPNCHLPSAQANAGQGQQDASHHHDRHSEDGAPLACTINEFGKVACASLYTLCTCRLNKGQMQSHGYETIIKGNFLVCELSKKSSHC